ncbi:large ribosomal RNA subunit accumulation protein YCED homolog 1, chloroplastic [Macadamia integrifolia]|uniref:large ribosomal RNA subunit accumulation protein YCED homolog 1, chloroplastic n=1 Tax=Macadamia integrifolia TaxID=60698 RepID=UPI001C4E7513|nr:large ribosomal RNA subunit accumulation protein YCED homolog 1, chloroplastic [Macadamia integrifolia]
MSVVFPSTSIVNSHIDKFRFFTSSPYGNAPSNANCKLFNRRTPWTICTLLRYYPPKAPIFTCNYRLNTDFEPSEEETRIDFDIGDSEDEDSASPWEGAVIYKRNPSVSHLEYCTTLERLGLEQLSTETSKSRASAMGLRVSKAVKDYPLGTPVQISIDVTRRKEKLRLDGILRTVITLNCNRCGEPAAECVFTNFTLILTEEPIEEPEVINMGVIFGEDKIKTSTVGNGEDDDDDALIDPDNWFYFPAEEREIDISKHIRDMVHLEITINAICDSRCKGICLKCGTNLNTGNCNCLHVEKEKSYGPLGNLRKQMQQKDSIKRTTKPMKD